MHVHTKYIVNTTITLLRNEKKKKNEISHYQELHILSSKSTGSDGEGVGEKTYTDHVDLFT